MALVYIKVSGLTIGRTSFLCNQVSRMKTASCYKTARVVLKRTCFDGVPVNCIKEEEYKVWCIITDPKTLLTNSRVALSKTCTYDEPRNEKKVLILHPPPPTYKKCPSTLTHIKYVSIYPHSPHPAIKNVYPLPLTQNRSLLPLPRPPIKCTSTFSHLLSPAHKKYPSKISKISLFSPPLTNEKGPLTQNIPALTPSYPEYTSILPCQSIKNFHPAKIYLQTLPLTIK